MKVALYFLDETPHDFAGDRAVRPNQQQQVDFGAAAGALEVALYFASGADEQVFIDAGLAGC
jgi:hypothetical protein